MQKGWGFEEGSPKPRSSLYLETFQLAFSLQGHFEPETSDQVHPCDGHSLRAPKSPIRYWVELLKRHATLLHASLLSALHIQHMPVYHPL